MKYKVYFVFAYVNLYHVLLLRVEQLYLLIIVQAIQRNEWTNVFEKWHCGLYLIFDITFFHPLELNGSIVNQ